jgi:hypothetical protein
VPDADEKEQTPTGSAAKPQGAEGTGPAASLAPAPSTGGRTGPESITPEARQMADIYFERGAQATTRGNFDYALHLFMDGLRRNPLDVEKGHKGLRELAQA